MLKLLITAYSISVKQLVFYLKLVYEQRIILSIECYSFDISLGILLFFTDNLY
jgi:hypothetical protein